jgi:hypothetical protein
MALEDHEGLSELAEDLESYTGLDEREPYDDESDPFLGDLVRTASSVIKSAAKAGGPNLVQNLATQAARVAGGAVAGQRGAQIATQIAKHALQEAEADPEGLYENELFEMESIDNEALEEAEFIAAQAAEAATLAEADQFIGKLLPMIGKLAKPLLSGVVNGAANQEDLFLGEMEGLGEDFETRFDEERDEFLPILAALAPMAMPLIKKGIGAVGKALNKSGAGRAAVRTLPRIAVKTASDLARQAESGKPITPPVVAKTLARQTASSLATRPRIKQAMRANRSAASRAQARPQGRSRRTNGHRPRGATSVGGRMPNLRGRTLVGFIPVYGVGRPASWAPGDDAADGDDMDDVG